MEKRVIFKGWWLPALLVAPQLIISFLFFFYPSGQAIWNSFFLPDPFGLKTEYVGLDNFRFLLSDPYYLASFKTTMIFSVAVSVSSMGIGLYLAALADRLIKGAGVYQTLLIWPYAIAPAIAGVLWLFLFNGNTYQNGIISAFHNNQTYYETNNQTVIFYYPVIQFSNNICAGLCSHKRNGRNMFQACGCQRMGNEYQ